MTSDLFDLLFALSGLKADESKIEKTESNYNTKGCINTTGQKKRQLYFYMQATALLIYYQMG